MINKFSSTLYVQMWENRIKVTDTGTGHVFDEKPLLATEKIAKEKKRGKKIIAFGNKAQMAVGKNIELSNPFSHPRMLVSDFAASVKLLENIFKFLADKKKFSFSPRVVIHPMEKIEGGLSVLEERIYREIAISAGAKDAVVYQGSPLPIQGFNFEAVSSVNKDPEESAGLSNRLFNLLLWFMAIVILVLEYRDL